MKINVSRIIAIEDSKYGIPMLEVAGLGIAFNPKDDEIRQAAKIIIEGNDLYDLYKILKQKDLLA